MSTGDTLGESQHDMLKRREDAFRLLVSAVELLQHAGRERPPTASEVRIQIRELTYGGFRLEDLGYTRFREFLAEAEQRQFIKLDHSREGDLGVSLPSVIGNKIPVRPSAIRRDLWQAFVNWNQSLARWYDIENDRAIVLPKRPAVLEPQEFQETRRRIEARPDSFVPIEPISVGTQIGWMREFAATVSDPELRKLLEASLDGARPVKSFVAILKNLPVQLDNWHVALSSAVRTVIDQWKENNPPVELLVIDRIDSQGNEEVIPTPAVEKRDQSISISGTLENIFRLRPGEVAWQWMNSAFPERAHSKEVDEKRLPETEIRERLHAAIDRMPLEELRKICIPVGYLYAE